MKTEDVCMKSSGLVYENQERAHKSNYNEKSPNAGEVSAVL